MEVGIGLALIDFIDLSQDEKYFQKFILKMKELSHCIKYMDLKSIHTK